MPINDKIKGIISGLDKTSNPFLFDFSLQKFGQFLNNTDYETWYIELVKILPEYNIISLYRVCHFLAQTAHESSDFNILSENLNYSVKGLRITFPKYFPNLSLAKSYQRQPQKIGNRVYANRMGNGPENSGDGYKYRGRWLIQITGKYNYRAASQDIYLDDRLVKDPDLFINNKETAVETACWFWNKNNLNRHADNNDITTITKIINGGLNGFEDRKRRFNKAINIFS